MILPKEHGTWMMFFLPVLLGVFLTSPNFLHLPFLIGWFFLFLSSTPLLNIVRSPKSKKKMFPWLVGYLAVASAFLLPVVLLFPILLWLGLSIVPLLSINVYFIKKRNERSLWNNFSGIVTFVLGGVGAHIIGNGQFTIAALTLFVITFFYFAGSAFYVKSLIRERKNRQFKKKSHLFHLFLLSVPWLLNIPLLTLAYLPSTGKDWLTSRKHQLKPIQIGIIEIVNGVVFFTLCLMIM